MASAGSTSPTSMQTECTSHQLAPEEQEEEMAITSSYWIEIKGESRDLVLPEQYLPQAQHRGIYSLLLSLRDSQGPSSECTWNISCVYTCLLV